jgi:GTP cyclohydrolase I
VTVARNLQRGRRASGRSAARKLPRSIGEAPAAHDPRLRPVQQAIADLIRALRLDPSREPELLDTPDRVARYFLEAFSGLDPGQEPDLATFPAGRAAGQLVVVRDLPFHSLCVHHLVPFFGRAHVAYLPAARLLGISAPARLLEYYARRPQLQERLGSQVAEHLRRAAGARGVAVLLEARHLCMETRGVRKRGLVQTWSALGELADPNRADALRAQLARGGA